MGSRDTRRSVAALIRTIVAQAQMVLVKGARLIGIQVRLGFANSLDTMALAAWSFNFELKTRCFIYEDTTRLKSVVSQ
jgi:hypothetical protein